MLRAKAAACQVQASSCAEQSTEQTVHRLSASRFTMPRLSRVSGMEFSLRNINTGTRSANYATQSAYMKFAGAARKQINHHCRSAS